MKKYHLFLLLIGFAFATSSLAQTLFVPTRGSAGVAVIDPLTDQVITQIPVGNYPIRLAMTPNRLKAFVSNGNDGTISVLDTVPRANPAPLPVGTRPGEAPITPDVERLFV